jgi:arylsulfatase A-like enzyme
MRNPLRVPAIALAAASLTWGACAPDAPPRPDVVLVSIDTLRADHLGAWGNPRGPSPHLDRIARRSAAFARCIAQAASTLPSHRSLFQSRVASRTGPASPMLAELLHTAGWATVAFTGGGNISAELGFAAGFDIYEESDAGLPWSVARLAAWRERNPGRPVFAFLHGYDVHVPYDPEPPFAGMYDPGYAGPVRPEETRALCRAVRGLDSDYAGDVHLDAADRFHLEALYDGGIRAADEALGRLQEWIEETDDGRGTLLVILSDHGEEFWDHGSLLHSHTVYQELVHVPLVVSLPGSDGSGALLPETVRNLDVAPTLLDALGLPAGATHEGTSLLARVRGTGGSGLAAVSEMRQWKAIAEWPWKLIVDGKTPAARLFRLDDDPGETYDVAAKHPARVRALDRDLVSAAAGVPVLELSPGTHTPELEERLRALGYVE